MMHRATATAHLRPGDTPAPRRGGWRRWTSRRQWWHSPSIRNGKMSPLPLSTRRRSHTNNTVKCLRCGGVKNTHKRCELIMKFMTVINLTCMQEQYQQQGRNSGVRAENRSWTLNSNERCIPGDSVVTLYWGWMNSMAVLAVACKWNKTLISKDHPREVLWHLFFWQRVGISAIMLDIINKQHS